MSSSLPSPWNELKHPQAPSCTIASPREARFYTVFKDG